jgi:uncharacterized protein DUF1566
MEGVQLMRSKVGVWLRSALAAACLTDPTIAFGQTIANGPYFPLPSWDLKIDVPQRFVVLANFNNEAVLDIETGLVWERSPSGTSDWGPAFGVCFNRTTGNRQGWRIPTTPELSTLIDPSRPISMTTPRLPVGHPFLSVGLDTAYWTAGCKVAIGPGDLGNRMGLFALLAAK